MYYYEFVIDRKLPEELKQKNKEDLMILDLLPDHQSAARTVTEFLAKMQNDCINCAIPEESRYTVHSVGMFHCPRLHAHNIPGRYSG